MEYDKLAEPIKLINMFWKPSKVMKRLSKVVKKKAELLIFMLLLSVFHGRPTILDELAVLLVTIYDSHLVHPVFI
jgi:hypothetical protein